jgi:predicted deacylase
MAFLGIAANPGEVVRKRIPIAEFADGSPVSLPVTMIRGAQDGPTLYLQGGLHGDEVTGVANCRASLRSIDPAKLHGTVVGVPVANVPAFLTRTRGYLNEERWLVDVNRIFPGSASGLLTERIAHTLLNDFVAHADLTIDFHTALDGCDIAPIVQIDPADDDHGTLEMRTKTGEVFGTPYIYYKPEGASFVGSKSGSGSMSVQADLMGKPMIVAEMGESRRVSWHRVPIAVRGVHNVLRVLDMEDGEPETDGPSRRYTTRIPVHCNRGGGLHPEADLGDEVTEGQVVARIVDVFGDTVEELTSPIDGFILRAMRFASVSTGAEIFWVAA